MEPVDPYSVIVIGVDREPITDLEKRRFDSQRHGEFGANPGDEELEGTIFTDGVLQSVAVRKVGEKYEVVDGVRRTLACRNANKLRLKCGEIEHKLPILILPACNDLEAALTQVELNLNREDDDPISMGWKFKVIVEEMMRPVNGKILPHTQCCERLAMRAKCSPSTVIQRIKLTQLSPDVQDQVRKGTIGVAVAVSLVNRAPQAQSEIVAKLIENGKGKSVEEARKQRGFQSGNGVPAVSDGTISKPPSVPKSTWRDVFIVVDNDDSLSHLRPYIDGMKIALGDLPIGHNVEILALLERVTKKDTA